MAIFIFILIISGNYIGELFPCRIQSGMANNVFFKHFIGYFTLLFFVLLTLPETSISKNISSLMLGSFYLYIFFIILSRTPSQIWLTVFILGAVIYILELCKQNVSIKKDEIFQIPTENIRNNSTKNKNTLKIEQQKFKMILAKNKKTNENISKTQSIIAYIVITLTIFGFFIYIGEKKFEYGKQFSYKTFIFGKPSCKGKTPKINLLTSIKNIFK